MWHIRRGAIKDLILLDWLLYIFYSSIKIKATF